MVGPGGDLDLAQEALGAEHPPCGPEQFRAAGLLRALRALADYRASWVAVNRPRSTFSPLVAFAS